MQLTELDRFSMEDRHELELKIRELTLKIDDAYSKQKRLFDSVETTPEITQWNAELRKLRRMRDNKLIPEWSP